MKCLRIAVAALAIALTGCGGDEDDGSSAAFEARVQKSRLGFGVDHWIEMKSLMNGQWERTGLIFGYVDDYGECTKAIGGLKTVNYAREYRCVPAN